MSAAVTADTEATAASSTVQLFPAFLLTSCRQDRAYLLLGFSSSYSIQLFLRLEHLRSPFTIKSLTSATHKLHGKKFNCIHTPISTMCDKAGTLGGDSTLPAIITAVAHV